MRGVKAKRLRKEITTKLGAIVPCLTAILAKQIKVTFQGEERIIPRFQLVNKAGSPKRVYRQVKRGTRIQPNERKASEAVHD